jgi:hypothetical protein
LSRAVLSCPLVANRNAVFAGIYEPSRDTGGQTDLLCKQEVAGSIPAGSTVGKCCKYLAFSPMGIRATRVPVAGRGA